MSYTYDHFEPTITNRNDWTLPHILSLRAMSHRDKVYLDVPDSGISYTFGEIFDLRMRLAPDSLSAATSRATAS